LSELTIKNSITEIFTSIENFTKIKSQKYPWFSSKTVDGIKLFQHFKNKNTKIERPSRDVQIKSVEILELSENPINEIEKYIVESVNKVNGDFRQVETIERWQEFFAKTPNQKLPTIKVKVLVSSGTYIRALTENFSYPTTLLKLNRTKIIQE
jgi:tRNA U55 pseudouridine synthase TruB